MVLVINLVNAQLKRQSVQFVKRLVAMQKFAEVNIEKQNNNRSNNQSVRFPGNKKKTPIFTWWQMKMKS